MNKLLPIALLLPTPLLAQEAPTPRIIVSGIATISTIPDRAIIAYSVHGEGTTSDDAVTAMVAKRKAIDAGIVASAARAEPRISQTNITEVRGPNCNRNTYNNVRLSTGECAIIGYTADLTFELRTAAVKDAATIVGLIGRLGGTNPRIERFTLADDRPAQTRAVAAALADARQQAEAVATGSKVRLGRLLSVSNVGGNQPFAQDIVVTGSTFAPPAPPPPPPPIAIDLAPRQIETSARVTVVYEIAP